MRCVTWDSVVAGSYRGGDYVMRDANGFEIRARIIGFILEDHRVLVRVGWVISRSRPEDRWILVHRMPTAYAFSTNMPRVKDDGVIYSPDDTLMKSQIVPRHRAVPDDALPKIIRDQYPRAAA